MKGIMAIYGVNDVVHIISNKLYRPTRCITGMWVLSVTAALYSYFWTSAYEQQNPRWLSVSTRNFDPKWLWHWIPRPIYKGARITLGLTACMMACPIAACFATVLLPTKNPFNSKHRELGAKLIHSSGVLMSPVVGYVGP